MRATPSASSSSRLNSLSARPRSQCGASVRARSRPIRQIRASSSSQPSKYSGGVMLWCSSTRRPRCSRNAAAERRGQREVQDHHVRGCARLPLGEAAPVAFEVLVELERVDVRRVAPGSEGVAHQPRRVPDRVAAVERGDPLVDPHAGDLGHRVTVDRAGGAPSSTGCSRSRISAPKSVARIPDAARVCDATTMRRRSAAVGDAVEHLRHELGVLVLEQQPAAAQRLADRAGVVRDDRQPEEHGLQERHAEALVLGEAEEHVGQPIAGQELVVSTCPVKTTLRRSRQSAARARCSRVEVTLEAAVVAHQQEPAPRVRAAGRGRSPDQVVDALVRDDAADEQQRSSGRPRAGGA